MPENAHSWRDVSRRLSLSGIPIFNYHGLAESLPHDVCQATIPYWLSPTKFYAHLALIRDKEFHTARLDVLKDPMSALVGNSSTVILTFDDGLASDYEIAFPLLAEFGMTAAFFLNTATIGLAGYLNWSQIAEMQRHGMSFQSHGHRHVDFTMLTDHALDFELNESKCLLEDRLGSQVDFLATPRGVLDRRVVRKARASGYRAVCSTRCLPARPGSTIFTRITLHRDVTIDEFQAFVQREMWVYGRRLLSGLLRRPVTIPSHLWQLVRHRWLKQQVTISR